MAMPTRDLAAIDNVLRLVNRELWIVTAQSGVRRGGLLATWVSAASVDREHPTMLIGLAPTHFTRELVDEAGCFGLHLIGGDQLEVAFDFTIGSGRERDKLAGRELFTSQTGAPLLVDCAAWCDCRVFARLESGDRVYFWADVLAASQVRQVTPAREQDLLAAATPEQMQALRDDRAASVATQRPAQAQWRAQLPELLHPPAVLK